MNLGASGTRQTSDRRQIFRSVPRTPRFIFSSSNPSGSASTPRFAATPRFALNDDETKQSQALVDDIDENQDDVETSSLVWAAPSHKETPRPEAPRDVIPDSEDDDSLSQEDTPGPPLRTNVREDSMEICEAEGDDILFPLSPSQREIKRRRLCGSPSQAGRGYEIEIDPIARSSEPESSPPLEDHRIPPEDVYDTIESPTTRRPVSTPLPTNMHSLFNQASCWNEHRGYGNPTPSLGMAPNNSSETLAPTITESTPFRRPRFILPITPSRWRDEDTTGLPLVDTLFSPTPTRNLRPKRARRPADLEYIPGEMASEVRNWILELSARKQTSRLSTTQGPRTSQMAEKFYVTAKIDKVDTSLGQQSSEGTRPAAPGHVAPKTLIKPLKQLPEERPKFDKILLFEGPLLISGVQSEQTDGTGMLIQPGDWIGIRRGIVWEMEISPLTGQSLQPAEIQQAETQVSSEKWLVGLEWDIILSPTTLQD